MEELEPVELPEEELKQAVIVAKEMIVAQIEAQNGTQVVAQELRPLVLLNVANKSCAEFLSKNQYILGYNQSYIRFTEYLQKQSDTAFKKNLKKYGVYLINDMELWLLSAAISIITDNSELFWQENYYSYFVSEAFFIRYCKKVLDIENDNKDFVIQQMDVFFPKILSLIEKVDPVLFVKINPLNVHFTKSLESVEFFKQARPKLSQLVEKAHSNASNVRFYLENTGLILELLALTRKYQQREHFTALIQNLFAGVKYRQEVKHYLEQKMAEEKHQKVRDFGSKFKQFTRNMEKYSDRFAKVFEDLVNDKKPSEEDDEDTKMFRMLMHQNKAKSRAGHGRFLTFSASDADLALLEAQKVADHNPEPKAVDKDKSEIKEANNSTFGKWSPA